MIKQIIRAMLIPAFIIAVYGFDVTGFVNWYSSRPEPDEPENLKYKATEVYTEFEDDSWSSAIAKMTTEKVYTKIGDSMDVEIISETTEGDFDDDDDDDSDEVDDDDDDKENHSMTMDDGPFGDQKAEYDFSYEGTQYFKGDETHIIRFKSKERDKEHFNGRALFGVSDSLMKKIELRFAKDPIPIKDMKMEMEFQYPGGYMVPSRFYMKIWAKIILLYDKKFEVDATYYDFELK